MKKFTAIVLASLMVCALLPLIVFAEDGDERILWSDYIESVEVLDLDLLAAEGRAVENVENTEYVFDKWYMPSLLHITMKDGSVTDYEIDTSGMRTAEDEVIFVLTVAPGVDLTFAEFIICFPGEEYYCYGISQKFGEGEDAEYEEVFSVFIDPDPDSGNSMDIFDTVLLVLDFVDFGPGDADLSTFEGIFAYLKHLIETIIELFTMFA
ncbi:MAG: hypothetical protein IJK23_14630 [Clostridia bacterium]|nr:hypothetical protein [Clostridia bacterium]